MSQKVVLFLCTCNYYRSRFAEIVFNHKARKAGLDWQATSRGLARSFGAWRRHHPRRSQCGHGRDARYGNAWQSVTRA